MDVIKAVNPFLTPYKMWRSQSTLLFFENDSDWSNIVNKSWWSVESRRDCWPRRSSGNSLKYERNICDAIFLHNILRGFSIACDSFIFLLFSSLVLIPRNRRGLFCLYWALLAWLISFQFDISSRLTRVDEWRFELSLQKLKWTRRAKCYQCIGNWSF